MRNISKLMLAALTAVAAMAIGVSIAAANSGEIVAHEGAEAHDYTGDIEATSTDSIFETGSGDINCDNAHATGEVTQSAVSGSDTTVGTLDSLVFTHTGGDHECEDDISGASDCEPTVEAGSLEVNANEAQPQLVFNGIEAVLHCQSLFGEIDCHYNPENPVVGDIHGSEVEVVEQHLVDEAGFPCPAEGLFSATFHLRTVPGGDEVELALD
jgi:hypothetical protein